MKHEWKKHEKDLYGVKQSPRIVDIPMQQFIMIKERETQTTKNFRIKYKIYINWLIASK